MSTIKCNNTRNDRGVIEKCDRFFMVLPDCLVDALRQHPGQKIITRCPTCPSYQRWIEIYYDKDKGLVWESVADKPIDFGDELTFDTVINSEQVG